MTKEKIKILVGCEFSGVVRDAFLELGVFNQHERDRQFVD